MAREIQYLTDGTSDLPPAWLKKHPEVTVVDTPIVAIKPGCPEVSFTGLTPDTFAEADEYVRKGYTTKTSLPVIWQTPEEEAIDIMSVERLTRQYLSEGKSVVYLAMNSAISGAFSQVWTLFQFMSDGVCRSEDDGEAMMTKDRVLCLDTQCASTGLAMLIMDLIASEPEDLRDVMNFVEDRRKHIAHVFTWFEFGYIMRSGKVNALSAMIGKLFGFHPICSAEYVDEARPLMTVSDRIRGTYKFIDLLSKFVRATIANEDGVITVAHGNLPDKAEMIAEALREYLPEAKVLQGPDWRCGAAIQAHGGPTSIHINYLRNPATYDETLRIFHEL